VKLFFSFSHKNMNWDEAENNSLFQLSPSWAVGEPILPNTFPKQLSFTKKAVCEAVFQKKQLH
jgi:hypothetical protein